MYPRLPQTPSLILLDSPFKTNIVRHLANILLCTSVSDEFTKILFDEYILRIWYWGQARVSEPGTNRVWGLSGSASPFFRKLIGKTS